MPEKITLEQLAQMIQRGFEETSRKEDVSSFREEVTEHFEDVDSHFKAVEQRLDSIDGEIKEIKIVLGPLARAVAQMEVDISTLRSRIDRLERRFGLT